MTENYANFYQSKLDGSITDVATTINVLSSSGAPTADFRIRIGSELMLVTDVSANTFTVTRGVEGTVAAAHADTTDVVHVLTAAALGLIIRQADAGASFPVSPNVNDRFYRTDRNVEYFWNGSLWLSSRLFTSPLLLETVPLNASATWGQISIYDSPLWLVAVRYDFYIYNKSVTSANDLSASDKWVLNLKERSGAAITGTTLNVVNGTSWGGSNSGDFVLTSAISVGAQVNSSNWQLQATKTGSPPQIYPGLVVAYRTIG